MKVWITKYGLTSGIYEAEVDEPEKEMIVIRDKGFPQYFHGKGREWCETEDDAKKCVSRQRKAKIASLHKQIAKLEKADWDAL